MKIPGRVDPRLELLSTWLRAVDRLDGPAMLRAQRDLRPFRISVCLTSPKAGGRP